MNRPRVFREPGNGIKKNIEEVLEVEVVHLKKATSEMWNQPINYKYVSGSMFSAVGIPFKSCRCPAIAASPVRSDSSPIIGPVVQWLDAAARFPETWVKETPWKSPPPTPYG